MNLIKLLPIPAGSSFSAWVETWVQEISVDLKSVIKDNEVASLRERNERLGSYLFTFQTILAAYSAKITSEGQKFAASNPPPDKGIKAWEAERDASLATFLEPFNFITSIYEASTKRISIAQSNIKSRTTEGQSTG